MNTISIHSAARDYDVLVGHGLLDEIGRIVGREFKASACAIISDENVAARFGDGAMAKLAESGFGPALITVPPGEQSKTMERAEEICSRMIEAGLDRSSFVVALGGGMIGDLAGFVAAIYHRGIPCVQVPTTLLAQVDSSIGGKTAVNTSAGKNLIGAWHSPSVVIADVETLDTLPPRELRQGFAEIVKHAVIRDPEMFEMLQSFKRADLPAVIQRNVQIKGGIVSADEREMTGERALLNFGHTIGHAVERAGQYEDFLHGEAVSLGIVAACEISVRKAGLRDGDRQRIVRTLAAFELPTKLPAGFAKDKILESIRFDKKFAQGKIRFVVVPSIGSARLAEDVRMDDIEAAVNLL